MIYKQRLEDDTVRESQAGGGLQEVTPSPVPLEPYGGKGELEGHLLSGVLLHF